MTRYARVDSGIVVEFPDIADGMTPSDCLHAELAASVHACGEDVELGWTWSAEDGFAAPAAPAPTQEQLLSHATARRSQVAVADEDGAKPQRLRRRCVVVDAGCERTRPVGERSARRHRLRWLLHMPPLPCPAISRRLQVCSQQTPASL